ncbi:hypothetical protein M378DRAFT_25549 [Amanita muscaria Koide BX008]|uniref:VWFA domain-containing protein n=1 Tax=Amanita muscaria (strain Koide BX008) TaxID=946122 RepID=A0A0C2WM11_AMAMK|nr:hypothetical protein M378DRAFT_25549 [Amanita muscaria Koide BX008]
MKDQKAPQIEVAEQPKKHQKIERCHAFSHLNWAFTASNLFLVLILLTSFITPSSCAESKTRAEIRMPLGVSEDDMTALTETATADRQMKRSESVDVKQMMDELATENIAVQKKYKKLWVTPGRSGYEEHIADPLLDEETCEFNPEKVGDWVGDSRPSVNSEDFEAWEAARNDVVLVKPPPSDTVEGYNTWLDKPRPADIHDYLRFFEVMFIVDDSSSMEGERWSETRDALETIAESAFEFKVDTVSLRFLNNERSVRGLKGKENLRSLFDAVRPSGLTPLGKTLKAVFDEHLTRIDSAARKGEEDYSKIPPLNIVVLTDGVPTDKPAEVIANTVKRLNDSHYHPNTMNVQIVQIANYKDAAKMLRDLVLGDNGRIVDTVPYGGVLDSDKLERILLGGMHPNTRS